MGLFRTQKTTVRADKISNFTVATAEYGAPIMELLGTTRISGNVIYYNDFTAHEHRETQRSGKGGGSKTTTISYTYTVAVMLGLCEGEISNIGKVWVGKNVYTYPHSDIQLTLFKGSQNQQPWPYLTAKHPDEALSYPGLAYMAGVIDLGDNASMPNYNFEVMGKLLDTGDGKDVNPADYILYVLGKVGLGDVPVAGIENYRAYCAAADLLISTPSNDSESKAAREVVNDIAELTNAYFFWSNDQFKIVPREDRNIGSWQANRAIIYDLTPDDFLPQSGGACVTYQRKDSSELYNRFSVEFTNRENSYERETVSYEDTEDIEINGVKQADAIQAHYIYSKARAVMIAESAARINKYERNRYTFKLGWAFCRLEVGDLVTLTDPTLGLDKLVVMIDSVVENAAGELTLTAIGRANADYSDPEYDVHDNERPNIDFNFQPGNIAPPAIFQPDPVLMYNDNELWIGAHGQNEYWGGCNVWVSENNTGYKLLGTINSASRIGSLISDITAESTSLEVKINGELISGTPEDAQNGNTLLWCDGESLSYTTATLLENGNYLLEGLVRGQYNTDAAAHVAGVQVVRCDSALLKANFLDSDVGKMIYLKFTSFNVFMANEQSLADVPFYLYTIQKKETFPPDVISLDVEVLYNGTRRYYWDFEYPEINNIAGFRMKYIQGNNPNWERGFDVQEGLITKQPYETNTIRQGIHTVMIKAVNSSGNESKNFAVVLVNFADPLEDNVLYKVAFHDNNWADVSTDGDVLDDGFVHAKVASAHWASPGSSYWNKPDANYWGVIHYNAFELTASITALAGGNFYFLYEIDGVADISYKIRNKDDIYKPYATKFDVRAGDVVDVKFTSPAGNEETVLKALTAIIDVPDREEHFENIYIPADGLELPIVTPNYMTTAVRIDSVNISADGIYQPEIVSKTPCVIKVYAITNDNGVWQREAVAVTADITWQGFIKETEAGA